MMANIYFVLNKSMPTGLAVDTWYRYWAAYSDDPLQQRRLAGAAIAALALVYGVPLAVMAAAMSCGRSLHGDARWATDSEIRKAGLL